jgi:hypothetical protein
MSILSLQQKRNLGDVDKWLDRLTPEFFIKSESPDSKENKEVEAYYKYDVKRLKIRTNHLRDEDGNPPEVSIDYRTWAIGFRVIIDQAREISLQR